jgi:dTDP-glucose 4,6-dehydratase
MPNIALVAAVCAALDELAPRPRGRYAELITPVPDRPGHDRRYSLDPSRVETELGWRPKHELRTGLRDTVRWYLEHEDWLAAIADGSYRNLTRLEASA